MYGSTLFLISSAFAIAAVADSRLVERRSYPWRIAWLNMIGSILFMASAVTSYVVPNSESPLNVRISVAGTGLGATCFLVGAALMFPAWKSSVARTALIPEQRSR